MNTKTISNDISKLSEDARELVTETTDVAGEKAGQARKCMVASLERGKEIYDQVVSRELERVSAADKVLKEHAYEAIVISIGVGALLGYFTARKWACTCR